MTLGAFREPRGAARRIDLAQRRRRELRDVRHPWRPDLRIERVLICPSGIHVVTTLPAGEETSARLLVAQAAADVVASLLPQRYRERVRPVLSRADDVAMAEMADGVLVTSPSILEHIVAASPVVLSSSEVNDVGLRLDARLEPFPPAPAQHRRRWRRRHSLLAAVVAAASAAGAFVLVEGVASVPLPW